ncbi:uncharacterized protein [Elaeis guineensis]|uniref:uncharacterized protein isoform X1 n=1 Tax=Elaeis guineensis var. tenera TaxID=51953 RepID=UPI003C6D3ED8
MIERGGGGEEMEGEGGGGKGWWWWAAASSAQLTAGIAWYQRGCGKSGAMMPFKAFAIATVFVSGGATAAAGALHATGIRTKRPSHITIWRLALSINESPWYITMVMTMV